MSPRDKKPDPERTLEEIEERVQRVQHLEHFECAVRSDGRVSFRLTRPPEELSREELEAAARVLEELAARFRARAAGTAEKAEQAADDPGD